MGAANKRAVKAARPVMSPEVPRLPVVVRVATWRPWSPWCEVWRCRCLTRRQTPLGSYCGRHAAAILAHFGLPVPEETAETSERGAASR